MTTYYVGPGGNDGSDGLSWANRKLTLNGAEDVPVAAADIVYVAPGVYRELLTVDISGGAGNIITYIADVTGEHTDGVGGIVRITGSDDDQTTTRNNCIVASAKDYRTFRGFRMDMTSQHVVGLDNCDVVVIEDCPIEVETTTQAGVYVSSTSTGVTIRRCLFVGTANNAKGVYFTHSAVVDDAGHVVENCLFLGMYNGILSTRVGGITARNCTVYGTVGYGIRVDTALTVGQFLTVNNSILMGCATALRSTAAAELAEDYNTLWGNTTDRNTTSTGAHSVAYPPLFQFPILFAGASQVSGIKFPWEMGELSEWSTVRAIAGTGEPTIDFLGIGRPATAAKNSYGALQFHDTERETTTKRTGTASVVFNDAGRMQIWVPVANESTTISVYCYREADYAGTNPQMVIKQPGQADRTTTDAGAAASWNQLTDTFTPAASPPYVIVELVSNNTNTASAATNDAFFDDLVVS